MLTAFLVLSAMLFFLECACTGATVLTTDDGTVGCVAVMFSLVFLVMGVAAVALAVWVNR